MTIHFVYAATPGTGAAARLWGKAAHALQRAGLPLSYVGDRVRVDTARWPASAPLSIAHHSLQALRSLGDVKLYDWRERVRIVPRPGDVLMGHWHPTDEGAAWNRACRSDGFALKVVLMPFVHELPHDIGRFEPYVERVDAMFAIMGPYWEETWPKSAFAHWQPKMTRLDMAVDVAHFPRLKRAFNPPGRREFVYVGWNGAPKGTRLLSVLFGLAKGRHRCVWIGPGGPLPNLDWRGPKFGRSLAEAVAASDVMVNLGTADANPTTLLEGMAWGLPVACTPQSGYWKMPEIRELSTTDMAHNLRVLDWFQEAPEAELAALADAGRRLVETRYHWAGFAERLTAAFKSACAAKGIAP